MIVLRWKRPSELYGMLGRADKILLVGCRGCATVCSAGGEKEVGELARLLRLAAEREGRKLQLRETMLERQCDAEFIQPLKKETPAEEAVLSLACGAGVQLLAEMLSPLPVLPACDTVFFGVADGKGRYAERCQACGCCRLHLTAGVCPVSRCSKSLLNGPCGGSSQGRCEVEPSTPCAWQLIWERLQAQGRDGELETIIEPADWSSAGDGGPRRLEREDLT